MELVPGRQRRRHSEEFKAGLVEQCRLPGMSLARVAQAHGLNPNLLRRWVKQGETVGAPALTAPSLMPGFVPLALPGSGSIAASEIRIELKRGATTVKVSWPAGAVNECASWLRALLG